MKTFLIFLVLLVLSRIETNEATRNLDESHLLLPSLRARPPIKTPVPNPKTEASHVNMVSTVTERNFDGHKKAVFAPPPPINAYHLDKTHLLLPSLQTRPPVKTPSPNPGTETSVNMASKITERNFVGRKEVFIPPPTNAYPFDKTHLPLPSLRTRPPIKTPAPNPKTEASHVNMASTVTERNFVGHKEAIFAPPPPSNAYPLDKTHLLLPSLQTRPPVKTPSPNPGTETSVNMASNMVTERNFVGRKEVFTPPPPTNAYPLDKTHLLLPSLQTRPPIKTPSPNPGTEASVNMASRITERNFAGRKTAFTPPPPINSYPLDKAHLLLSSLQTRPPVKTPAPNSKTEGSVNMASTIVTERNFVGCKEVVFAPPPPPLPSTNAYPQNDVLFDVSIATSQK